jgi:uncharacterized protein
LLVAGAGLVTSVHCAGMCGPLVMSCNTPKQVIGSLSMPGGASIRTASIARLAFPHALYNGGRMLSYGLLGGLAGMFGAAVSSILNVGPWLAYTLGIWLVIAGFVALGSIRPAKSTRMSRVIAFVQRPSQLLKSLLSPTSANDRSFAESRFILGFLTPLLPCGLVYTMLLKAAATSDPVQGMLEMSVFALASAPMLMSIGVFSNFATARFARHARHLTWALMILMGVLTIMRGADANPLAKVISPNDACCTKSNLDHKH